MRSALRVNPAQLEFDFADRLRKALRVSDMGPGELADLIEVHRNTVSNWINGHAVPRPRDIRAVAEETGVPVEWLLTGETEKAPIANDGGREARPKGFEPLTFWSVVSPLISITIPETADDLLALWNSQEYSFSETNGHGN